MGKIFNLLLLIFTSAVFLSAGEVLLDKPRELETVFHGAPAKNYHNIRSRIVKAKPNTWYRLSVEIKTAFKPGKGRLKVSVRHIRSNGKSIVYSDVVTLEPAFLEFNKFSGIFLTKPETASLQVYYHQPHLDGYAQYRNLKLEELDPVEAENARKAIAAAPAYFSAPVYAYSGEKELPWGYRVSADLLSKAETPAKITFEIPELKAAETVPAKLNSHAVYTFSLKEPLKKGKYQVKMSALDAAGKTLAQSKSFLRVIDRPHYARRLPVKSISVDGSGNTLINGKPVLLNGLYHVYTAANFREIADAGFNSAQAWESRPQTYLKMLNNMKDNDLYANCVLKLIKNQALADLMKVIGGHETIISFDPVDEPDIKNVSIEEIMATVNQVNKAFPGRLSRISLANASAAGKFVPCVDIIAAHDYVIPFGGLERLAQSVDLVVKAAGKGKSPQMTLQSWIHWHDPKRVPQTPEQTVSMAYLALICGAKGLWWYSFIDKGSWDVRTVPSIWTVFKGLNAQLEELSPVILTGKRIPVKADQEAVGCALWQTPERSVFVMVNKGKTPVNAKITGLPGKCQLAELFADGEVLKVSGGSVTVPVNGETTRVFELKK